MIQNIGTLFYLRVNYLHSGVRFSAFSELNHNQMVTI